MSRLAAVASLLVASASFAGSSRIVQFEFAALTLVQLRSGT